MARRWSLESTGRCRDSLMTAWRRAVPRGSGVTATAGVCAFWLGGTTRACEFPQHERSAQASFRLRHRARHQHFEPVGLHLRYSSPCGLGRERRRLLEIEAAGPEVG